LDIKPYVPEFDMREVEKLDGLKKCEQTSLNKR